MKKSAVLLAATVLAAPLSALAAVEAYVYSPIVEQGEKDVEFVFGTARRGDDPRESAAGLALSYGVTAWWSTEFELKYKRANGENTHYDAVEWRNVFQFTETGKYAADLGLLLEIERPKTHAEGWEVKWGPLVQTDFGKVQLNANVFFKRNYQAEEAGPTNLLYQWQAKYRWLPKFEYGLQGMGEMGQWDHWAPSSEQIHKVGPAVFGKIHVGEHQALKYDFGVLFGMNSATPDHTVRLKLEYEF